MTTTYHPAIADFIASVVDHGSHYRMDEMEALYTADQSILFLGGDGIVIRASRAEMMAEFAARGAAGEPPLSTEYRILHVEQQGDVATAILYRRMSPVRPPAMYELRMAKQGGKWMVTGETVTPFPADKGGESFLPPRTR
jgi:hypothetical protein